MILIDLIENIHGFNQDQIIFQENLNDFNSMVTVSTGNEDDSGEKIENGITYHYLIEIFLARQFIEDWINGLDYYPSDYETAKRLHDYAINDA